MVITTQKYDPTIPSSKPFRALSHIGTHGNLVLMPSELGPAYLPCLTSRTSHCQSAGWNHLGASSSLPCPYLTCFYSIFTTQPSYAGPEKPSLTLGWAFWPCPTWALVSIMLLSCLFIYCSPLNEKLLKDILCYSYSVVKWIGIYLGLASRKGACGEGIFEVGRRF